MVATQQSSAARSRRTALVVAGMHRSGTSAMARVLSLAGGEMPERLINAGTDNPLGFWEPRDMVALNDEILSTIGSSWNDVFGFQAAERAATSRDEFLPRARSVLAVNYSDAALAVAKDPRVSLLVPLWCEAMEAEDLAPAFVIMVRDPLEVAQSIATRDGAPLQASMLAWLSHMIAVERDTRDVARIFVSYDALIEDWEAVLETIRRRLSMPLPVSPDQAAEISRFLSPSARHHSTDDATWIGRSDLWPGIADAWQWFKTAAADAGPPIQFPERIMNGLVDLEAQFGPVLKAQSTKAALRERELQAVIADRETVSLRLRAQVREYEVAITQASEALAGAHQEVAEARSDVAALKAEASRRESDSQAAWATALDAHALDRVALGQVREDLKTSRLRIAQLEQDVTTTIGEASERERQMQTVAEDLRQRIKAADSALAEEQVRRASLEDSFIAAEARTIEVSAELEAVAHKLDTVLASPSWGLTRPIRVVSKRFRALKTGG